MSGLSGSKLFDPLMVILKEILETVDFDKNQQTTKNHEKLPNRQSIKRKGNTSNIMPTRNKASLNIVFFLKKNTTLVEITACNLNLPLLSTSPTQEDRTLSRHD